MPTNDGSFADIILATIIGKRQTLIAMGAAAVAVDVAVSPGTPSPKESK